jgi:hypothetical protein
MDEDEIELALGRERAALARHVAAKRRAFRLAAQAAEARGAKVVVLDEKKRWAEEEIRRWEPDLLASELNWMRTVRQEGR